MTKIYFALWGLVGIAAAILMFAGGMNMLAVVTFGFIAFGLTFMGMIGLLPILVTHPPENQHQVAASKRASNIRSATNRVGSVVASVFDINGIEVQKPKYP